MDEFQRWRDFETEPPPEISRKEYCIMAASSVEGKWLIDCAGWSQIENEWRRDFWINSTIEKWRPIGPMPEEL